MIFTYDLQTRKQIHSWKTGFNTRGLCSVVYNQDQQQFLLVFPDESVGSVKFVRICSLSHKILDEKVINAHESSIRCFQLSYDGSLLATASEKGTLIRLFHTSSGEKKEEFRRGNTTSGIYSICFSHDNNYVACVSSNGTLHVFVVGSSEYSWMNGINTLQLRSIWSLGKTVEKSQVTLGLTGSITCTRQKPLQFLNNEILMELLFAHLIPMMNQ